MSHTMSPASPSPTDHTSWPHIWRLAWPIMLSNVTIPLVGAVDVAMMGRLDDPVFIGGVGLGMLVFNFIYFGLGFLRMGTTGLVAQNFGRGAASATLAVLARGVTLALLLGLIAIALGPVIISLATSSLSASPAAETLMADYIAIRLFAVPAALANMVLLGGLYGSQQMRLGMALLLLVNGLNLALDALFVIGLGLAAEGVALASVIAQWGGFFFMIWRVGHIWPGRLRGVLSRGTHGWAPDWFDRAAFMQFFQLGRDIFIRTLLLLGCEALLLDAAARLDDVALALVQIMLSLFGIIAFSIDGFAHAAEALVGEAIGRRDPAMLNKVVARTTLLAGVMAVLLSLIIWVGEVPIMMLMTAQDPLIEAMRPQWVWVALLPLASFLAFQMDGIFVGATCGRQMRNAMLVAASLFAVVLTLQPFGLGGMMAAFAAYLAVRGLSLYMLFGRVRAKATPDGND